ncbi:MAG: hypothetical protein NUV91_07890, partial [Candidatus Omnitrophica bacterium]|nr:hypothetical protein [Candidatus Omnitrophota bacterium]
VRVATNLSVLQRLQRREINRIRDQIIPMRESESGGLEIKINPLKFKHLDPALGKKGERARVVFRILETTQQGVLAIILDFYPATLSPEDNPLFRRYVVLEQWEGGEISLERSESAWFRWCRDGLVREIPEDIELPIIRFDEGKTGLHLSGTMIQGLPRSLGDDEDRVRLSFAGHESGLGVDLTPTTASSLEPPHASRVLRIDEGQVKVRGGFLGRDHLHHLRMLRLMGVPLEGLPKYIRDAFSSEDLRRRAEVFIRHGRPINRKLLHRPESEIEERVSSMGDDEEIINPRQALEQAWGRAILVEDPTEDRDHLRVQLLELGLALAREEGGDFVAYEDIRGWGMQGLNSVEAIKKALSNLVHNAFLFGYPHHGQGVVILDIPLYFRMAVDADVSQIIAQGVRAAETDIKVIRSLSERLARATEVFRREWQQAWEKIRSSKERDQELFMRMQKRIVELRSAGLSIPAVGITLGIPASTVKMILIERVYAAFHAIWEDYYRRQRAIDRQNLEAAQAALADMRGEFADDETLDFLELDALIRDDD